MFCKRSAAVHSGAVHLFSFLLVFCMVSAQRSEITFDVQRAECPTKDFFQTLIVDDDELVAEALAFADLVLDRNLYDRPNTPGHLLRLMQEERYAKGVRFAPPPEPRDSSAPGRCDDPESVLEELFCRVQDAIDSLPDNVNLDLFGDDEDWSRTGELEQCSADMDEQRAALMEMYNMLDGENWRFNNESRRWGASDCPCDWEGVSCNSQGIHRIQAMWMLLTNQINVTRTSEMSFKDVLHAAEEELFRRYNSDEIVSVGDNDSDGDGVHAYFGEENLYGRTVNQSNLDGRVPRRCRGPVTSIRFMLRNVSGDITHAPFDKLPCLRWANFLCNPNIVGSFPPALTDVPNLQYVAFIANGLSGFLPDRLGDLEHLRVFVTMYNYVEGPWDMMTRLHRLRVLLLSDNFLGKNMMSTIPDSIGNLTNLNALYLSSNGISGTLPDSIGDCSSLNSLYMHDNLVQGTVPLATRKWKKHLNALRLDWNRLEGTIPGFVSNITTVIEVGSNSFVGFSDEFTESLNDCPLMTRFRAQNLFLDGAPLPSFSRSFGLYKLDISAAGLSGTLPAAIGNLTSLQILRLFSNGLSGTIPTEWESLTNLEAIELSTNRLEGTVPAWIGNLPALYQLSLHQNSFTDIDIPEINSLAVLKQVVYLQLSNNNISEPIPRWMEHAGFIEYFDISNNRVPGNISISPYPGDATYRSFFAPTTFLASNNRLQFPVDEAFRALQSFKNLNFADNDLSGTFPAFVFEGDMETMIFDNNPNLGGLLPDVTMRSTAVNLLSFINTSLSLPPVDVTAHLPPLNSLLPRWLAATDQDNLYAGDFSCPVLSVTTSSFGRIELSPSFFGPYCQCVEGYLGVVDYGVGHCQRCSFTDGNVKCSGTLATFNDGGGLLVVPECAPPFEDCQPQDGKFAILLGFTDCAGECAKDCELSVWQGVKCSGPKAQPSGVCREGYAGRQCGRCDMGWFRSPTAGRCYECTFENVWVWTGVFVVIWVVAIGLSLVSSSWMMFGQLLLSICLYSVSVLPEWFFVFMMFIMLVGGADRVGKWTVRYVQRRTRRMVAYGMIAAEEVEDVGSLEEDIVILPGLVESIMFYFQVSWSLSLTTSRHLTSTDFFTVIPAISGLECLSRDMFDYFGRFLFVMSLPLMLLVSFAASFAIGCVVLLVRRKIDTEESSGGITADEMHALVKDLSVQDDELDERLVEEAKGSRYHAGERKTTPGLKYAREMIDDVEYSDTYAEQTSMTFESLGWWDRQWVMTVTPWARECFRTFLVVILPLYFLLIARIFLTFRCQEAPFSESGPDSYMLVAPHIPCTWSWSALFDLSFDDSTIWTWLAFLSGVFGVLYGLGIPAIWMSLLIYSWKKQTLRRRSTLETIGFLLIGLREQHWYWSVFATARLLVFAAIVTLLAETYYLVVAWSTAMMIFFGFQIAAQPFSTKLENTISVFSLGSLWFLFLCSVSLSAQERIDADADTPLISAAMLISAILTVLVILIGLVTPAAIASFSAIRFARGKKIPLFSDGESRAEL